MQKKAYLIPLLLLLGSYSMRLCAQASAITPEFKTSTIKDLSDRINAQYVFPDVAKKTGEHLQKQLKAGAFDPFNDVKTFADALTKEVQAVNKDKHMRIRPAPSREGPAGSPESIIEDKLEQLAFQRSEMAGFREAKRLNGNIGYIDFRYFAPVLSGAPVADRYMGLLQGVDAMIIDLRYNGGGNPGMVQYLCSYFFDEHLLLNSLYWREGDRTEEFWTLDKVGGKKMPDVPLFILTSSGTFSGAEEFCYNMQTRKRATLVGETTGGGANPGGFFPINDKLGVFIPTGTAINPVTKKNWEGTGVEPEVKTSAEAALDKAIELAGTAAEAYRNRVREKSKALLAALINTLEEYSAGSPDDNIQSSLKKCNEAGVFHEDDINALGYDYLLRFQKPATAEVIFKGNTLLYPESPNVYDSYGEALLARGKKEEARKSYQKAVELAEIHKDPNLELFKKNLKALEQGAEKRP